MTEMKPVRRRNGSRLSSMGPMIMALEPRLMFDGAAIADAAQTADAAIKAAPAPVVVRDADPSKDSGRKEVAFVDTSVKDYKVIEAGIRDGVAIVEIGGGADGLAQMAQWAETHSGYDAIHVISHGSEGTLHLGSATITAAGISDAMVQVELSVIGQALNADGDLLLYGCNVARGEAGQAFVTALATSIGADVAASDDATGAAGKGGNWSLERVIGYVGSDHLDNYGYEYLLGNETLSVQSATLDGGGVGPAFGLELTSGEAGSSAGNIELYFTSSQSGNKCGLVSILGLASYGGSGIGIFNSQSGDATTSYSQYTDGNGDNVIDANSDDTKYFWIKRQDGGAFSLKQIDYSVSANVTLKVEGFNGATSTGTVTAQYSGGYVFADKSLTTALTSVSTFNYVTSVRITGYLYTQSWATNLQNGSLELIDNGTLNFRAVTIGDPIASPTFTSGTTANFAENATGTVYTAAATASSGGGTVSYSIVDGADQAKFSITNGALTFASSPNYESPTDSDTNNTYVVTVRATDTNGTADQTVTVTVTNVNEAPSFTSATTASFAENGTGTVYTATSTDPDAGATATYSIVGGADQAKFSITNGALTFASSPNYESPTDSDTNNTYVVTLRVSDGTNNTDQTVTVTVTDANDAPVGVNDTGSATEAGGLSNGTAGASATGNVLTNDTDQDSGATKTVTAIRTGSVEGAGTGGTVGASLSGTYGSLTLNSDGSYTYVVNDSNATVQALASGQTLTDNFNYTVSDGTATDIAVLAVTINGANDLPSLGGTFTTAGTVNDNATTTPFSSVTFTDPDAAAVTLAITYTAANGTLSSGGGGLTGSAGSYTLSGASPAALQTLLQALVFTPTANQTAPGGTVVTAFTLTPADAIGSGTANATTQVTATSINDVPALDLDVSNGGSTGYTSTFSAGGSAVVIANTDATLGDVDAGAAISSLTATLGARPDGDANESLSLGTAAQTAATNAGLTVGYTAGTGVLSITGSAAPSVYQTVLRGVTYNNTAVSNVTDRSVSIVANDGTGNSNTATATVQVKFAPVIDLNSGTGGNNHSASFTEDGGAVALSSTSAITDADDANLTQMVVTLTNPQDGANEVLSSTYGTGAQTVNGESLTFTLSNANHTMTITGTGTKASYQMAIDSLRYNNTSQAPNTTARTVTFVGTDAHGDAGASSTATVSVTAVNDAPALSGNLSLSAVNEDTASPAGATIASLASGVYSDPDNGAETINGLAIIANTANSSTQGAWQYSTDGTNWFAVGTVADGATALALSAATKLRFVPVADYNGTPTALSARALDASYTAGWTSGSTKVTVDTTSTGGTTAIAATARSVTTSITSVNDSPSATLTSSSVAFNTTDGYVAVDTAITLADVDSANLTRAVVTITNPQDGASETLSSTYGTGAQTVNGETLTFTLSNSNHTMTITGTGTKATYQLALRSIRFNDSAGTPNNTVRTVSILVRDDSADAGTQDSATVNRSVTFNNAPAAGGAALTLTEGQVGRAYSFSLPAGTFTDADNDTLSYTVSGLPAGLTMSTAGVISGNPTTPVDPVTLTFTATDPSNATATKTATLKIKAAPSPPPPPPPPVVYAPPPPPPPQPPIDSGDKGAGALVTFVRPSQNQVPVASAGISAVGGTPINNLVQSTNQSAANQVSNDAKNAASFGTSQPATISMVGGTPITNMVGAVMAFASQKTAFNTFNTPLQALGAGGNPLVPGVIGSAGGGMPQADKAASLDGEFRVSGEARLAGGGDVPDGRSPVPQRDGAVPPGKLAKAVGKPPLTEQLRMMGRDGARADGKALLALLQGRGRVA